MINNKKKTKNASHLPMFENNNNKQVAKPPVVVILGHIDHGKTSLLLSIRNLNVPSDKPGGIITQHIGVCEIDVGKFSSSKDMEGQRKITFIDTPGHEAFSAMRSRGAKVADIATLVVAADEGVNLQTKEAILHIKKASLPLIVAINKIDKPEADPEKVKRELAKEDVLVESLGGKIPAVEVSALEGKGISDLLDLILLLAEMENLKTNLEKPGQGVIIEAHLDSQRGPTATLILNQGVLKLGQIIGTLSTSGKVKILEDFQGNVISQALPSQPVIVLGLENVPKVGEAFKVFSNLEQTKNYLQPEKFVLAPEKIDIETKQKILNLVLKADVSGSLEAIEEILKNLPRADIKIPDTKEQEEIILRILKKGVGEITESDIKLALRAKAKILGFRVKINPIAQAIAKREKVKIMHFDVIYDLVEWLKKHMEKLLQPKIIRTDLGEMKVLVVFLSEKNRQIVGGKIIKGQIKKSAFIEILRQGEVKGRGKIINLQKNKKDIEKAGKGEEVGILYEGNEKIEKDDLLTIYSEEKKKVEL